jgi:RimJ/RimL family protein N-acetyltransferase
LEIVQHSRGVKAELGSLFEEYSYGRYCSDRTLDVAQARRLERDRCLAFLQDADSCTWLALDGGEPVGLLGLRISEWDTAFWGVKYVSIEYVTAAGSERKPEQALELLMNEADAWCRQERVEFCVARVDARDLKAIHALERHGFRYIETTVENSFDFRRASPPTCEMGVLRPPRPGEEIALVAATRAAFASHRFYADPGFPRERVDAMYESWVVNSLRDSKWQTLVLEVERVSRGFLTYRLEDLTPYLGLRLAKWRMAALAPEHRGKGYGEALFAGTLRALFGTVDIVDSGLTTRNLRSVNLHSKIGFRTVCCSVTLHRWNL